MACMYSLSCWGFTFPFVDSSVQDEFYIFTVHDRAKCHNVYKNLWTYLHTYCDLILNEYFIAANFDTCPGLHKRRKKIFGK